MLFTEQAKIQSDLYSQIWHFQRCKQLSGVTAGGLRLLFENILFPPTHTEDVFASFFKRSKSRVDEKLPNAPRLTFLGWKGGEGGSRQS